MTRILNILSKNKQKGIRIQLDKSGLNLSIKGDLSLLTKEDKLELSENKEAIVSFLKDQVISPIPNVPSTVDGRIALTSIQKAIWLACKINGSKDIYIIPTIYRRKVEKFDFQVFQEAISEFVESNEVLSYRFGEDEGEPFQEKVDFRIGQHVSHHVDSIGISDNELNDRICHESKKPLDFEEFAPWSLNIYSLGDDEYCFLVRIHHLIADGTSIGLLINGMMEQYEARLLSTPKAKPSLQFYEYVAWIENRSNFESSSNFWISYLKDYPDFFEFILKHQVRDNESDGIERLTISKEENEQIQCFLKSSRLSLSSVFTYAFGLVLSKHAMTSEVIIGTPTESRTRSELRNIIGNLANILPVRIKINSEGNVFSELNDFKMSYLQILENQLYPFRYILEDIHYSKSKSETDLFNVIISFPNYQSQGSASNLDLDIGNTEVEFKIALTVFELEDTIQLKIEYRDAIMSSGIARNLLQQLSTVILQFALNPEEKLSNIRLGDAPEINTLQSSVTSINLTEKHRSILDRIDSIRLSNVYRTAVIQNDVNYSYNVLWTRAQSIAARLSTEESEANSPVVVELGNGFDLVTTILGIWMAGQIYVPIGLKTPKGRKKEIMEDCKSTIYIDSKWLEEIEEMDGFIPTEENAGNAYIIYTSGSSGVPKGVVVSHDALLNKLEEESDLLPSEKDIISLTLTNPGFDVSFLELILPLFNGGCIVVTDNEKDLPEVYALIDNYNVNILQGTPSYFAAFIENLSDDVAKKLDGKLAKLCIGGESMNEELLFNLKSKLPSVQINNHYGPTETTIDAVVNENLNSFESNSIGKPLRRTEVFIVDDNDNCVPVGVPGELLIAGPSLAEGYWNNVELSAEKFSYNVKLGKKVYRSGDIASWSTNGEILFVGRKDRQLKFKGFRIELEEISARIRQIEEVGEAHSTVIGNVLYAFYTAKTVGEDLIKDHLKQVLPSYMIPSFCICLDEMPLTTNGKIDEDTLKEYRIQDSVFTGPRNPLDEQIIDVWKNILKKDTIGIEDNFFELGGTSMSLYKVFRQLSEVLSVEIELQDLLEHTTVIEVSDYLQSREIEKLTVKELEAGMTFPLATTQERLWFYTSSNELSRIYNISIANRIEGMELDLGTLERAFLKIQDRHDILRTRFTEKEGKVELSFAEKNEGNFSVRELDTNENPYGTLDVYSKEAYSFNGAPLIRLNVLKDTTNNCFFLFAGMHHIISDGISFQIFFEELYQYYFGLLKTEDFVLPELPYQYKDFIADEARLKVASEDFWRKKLSKKVYSSPFKPEFSVNTNKREGDYVVRLISSELVSRVTDYCSRLGVTDMALYQMVCAALSWSYYEQKDLIISSPTHGRVKSEWTNLIGYFVNIVPFTCELDNTASFDSNVRKFHSTNREILKYQLFSHTLLEDNEIARNQKAAGYNSVFDFVLSIADIDIMEVSEAASSVHQLEDNVQIEQIGLNDDTSKFDLNLIVQPGEVLYNLTVAFDANKYRRDAIVEFLEHAVQTLELIVTRGWETPDEGMKYLNIELPFKPVVAKSKDTQEGIRSKMLDTILDSVMENWDRSMFTNYFERGGSSLKALQLLGEIQTNTGKMISILDFYLNPSYDYLQGQIQEFAGEMEHFKLNKFNELAGRSRAMIFFPPALGQSSLFGELASKFSDQFDCLGFDFFSEDYLLNNTADSISNDLARAIDSLEYEEVVLLAYSAGVNIAYSVSQNLKTNIEHLIFLDGLPNTSLSEWPGDDWFRTAWEQHIAASSVRALSELQFKIAMAYSKKSMEFIPQKKTNAALSLFENEFSADLEVRMSAWRSFGEQNRGEITTLKGGHYNILDSVNVEVIKKELNTKIKKNINV